MPNVVLFLAKNWRNLGMAAAAIGIIVAVWWIRHDAAQGATEKCQNEVIIKELTHVVEVKQKQNAAAAARPVNRAAVIERMQSHYY